LPVRVLSVVFRRHYLAGLRVLHAAGRLRLGGSVAALADATAFAAWLEPRAGCAWVVHSKPPVHGDPEIVLKYLARYVHRVALANSRLLDLGADQVTFTYKDYAHGGKPRAMTLAADEFLRRFVQHILPRGFVKVRHYGLLANRGRETKLARCRHVLGVVVPPVPEAVGAAAAAAAAEPAGPRCPHCGGIVVVVEVWPRPRAGAEAAVSGGRGGPSGHVVAAEATCVAEDSQAPPPAPGARDARGERHQAPRPAAGRSARGSPARVPSGRGAGRRSVEDVSFGCAGPRGQSRMGPWFCRTVWQEWKPHRRGRRGRPQSGSVQPTSIRRGPPRHVLRAWATLSAGGPRRIDA
jgi:hypothetical protein